MIQRESAGARATSALRCVLGHASVAAIAVAAIGLVAASCAADGGDDTVPTANDWTGSSTVEQPLTPDTTATLPLSTMTPGDITETVPPGAPGPSIEVALDDIAELDQDVRVAVESVTPVETESATPGEISGPGVALAIRFDNGSPETLDLSNVVVDLVDTDGVSATPIANGASPFSGALEAGGSETATYVFTIEEERRRDVTIHLSSSSHVSTIRFTGDVI